MDGRSRSFPRKESLFEAVSGDPLLIARRLPISAIGTCRSVDAGSAAVPGGSRSRGDGGRFGFEGSGWSRRFEPEGGAYGHHHHHGGEMPQVRPKYIPFSSQ